MYCPKCGEPWHLDSLHDVAAERYGDRPYDEHAYGEVFSAVREEFRRRGCQVLGSRCSTTPNRRRAHASAILLELLGDDVDGVISELADLEYLTGGEW